MTATAKKKPLFRYTDGPLPNTLAMSYTLFGYVAGVALLFVANPWLNALGTLLLAHAMVIAAYLIHEFAHGTIFSVPKQNQWAGNVCSWMAGSCYAEFQDLRKKHMRHHVDRADVITFDSKAFLMARPVWVRKLVLALEWAYVPAVELIMHWYVVALPFVTGNEKHRARRGQVALIFVLRTALFAIVGLFSLKALAFYALAWMIMLTVLRFADATSTPTTPSPCSRKAACRTTSRATAPTSSRTPTATWSRCAGRRSTCCCSTSASTTPTTRNPWRPGTACRSCTRSCTAAPTTR